MIVTRISYQQLWKSFLDANQLLKYHCDFTGHMFCYDNSYNTLKSCVLLANMLQIYKGYLGPCIPLCVMSRLPWGSKWGASGFSWATQAKQARLWSSHTVENFTVYFHAKSTVDADSIGTWQTMIIFILRKKNPETHNFSSTTG